MGMKFKIAGQFLGFLCMPFAEKEKEFKEEGRAAHWAGLRWLKRIEVIIFSFPYMYYPKKSNGHVCVMPSVCPRTKIRLTQKVLKEKNATWSPEQ